MTVQWFGDRVLSNVRAATVVGLQRGVEAVRTEAVSLMVNSPRGGRWYGKHKASAPGEPPAPDTGELLNSVTTSVDAAALNGNVNFGSGHAAAMEFGTVKVAPRPYARPALANKLDEAVADIADEVRKALI